MKRVKKLPKEITSATPIVIDWQQSATYDIEDIGWFKEGNSIRWGIKSARKRNNHGKKRKED